MEPRPRYAVEALQVAPDLVSYDDHGRCRSTEVATFEVQASKVAWQREPDMRGDPWARAGEVKAAHQPRPVDGVDPQHVRVDGGHAEADDVVVTSANKSLIN